MKLGIAWKKTSTVPTDSRRQRTAAREGARRRPVSVKLVKTHGNYSTTSLEQRVHECPNERLKTVVRSTCIEVEVDMDRVPANGEGRYHPYATAGFLPPEFGSRISSWAASV